MELAPPIRVPLRGIRRLFSIIITERLRLRGWEVECLAKSRHTETDKEYNDRGFVFEIFGAT